MTPEERRFIDAARTLVGTPWRHRGRKPWALDCIGLVVLAGVRARVPIEDETGYGREPWEDRIRKGCQRRWGAPLPADQAQPGDVAVIQWGREEPTHLGIVADHPDGGLSLIHAHNLHGVVEQRIEGSARMAVVEVYRMSRPA